MNSDLFLGVIAFMSVISPVINTLLTNHHQTKLHTMDLQHELKKMTVMHEREILENAMSDFGSFFAYHDANTRMKAAQSLLLAKPYLSRQANQAIDSLVFKLKSSLDYSNLDLDKQTVNFITEEIRAAIEMQQSRLSQLPGSKSAQ